MLGTKYSAGGAKVQVTGRRSGHRLQATGHRLQVPDHRPQVRSQVTGHITSNLSLHLLGQPWVEFWLPSKGYFQISYCPIVSIVGSFSF